MKQSLLKRLLTTMAILMALVTSTFAQTDVTSTYLTNASFDNSCNYLYDATSSDLGTSDNGSTVLDITGWTKMYEGWSAGATFEYSYAGTLNAQAIPSTASDGTTTGTGEGALGVCGAWGGSVYYSQSVTLPAGTYKLKYKGYNSFADATAATSLVGWVPTSGSSALSSKTSFEYNTWTADSITFTLDVETAGTIQVGVQSPGSGSGSNARIFIDDLQLFHTAVVLNDDATLSNISIDAGSISPSFDPTITNYIVVIPDGTSTIELTPTLNDSNASYTGGGSIDVSSGDVFETIAVTAENGGTTKSYKILFINDCFIPEFSDRINLIGDPTFSAASFSEGGYGGWGPKALTSAERAYCGKASAYILGSCWPDGGSLDRSLNTANGNALKANTSYRLRAMINSQASSGSFQFEIEGYDGSSSIKFQIGATDGWEQFDTVFTTGATVSEHGIYFNSCTDAPPVSDTCFIDNYELYEVNNDLTLSELIISEGTLTPAFDPAITTYSVIIPSTTTTVSVTATANSLTSSVSGETEVAIVDGAAIATYTVTAESGSTGKYIINFSSVASSDTTLSAINIDANHVLSPAFDASTSTYTATVVSGVDSVIVYGIANHAAASVSDSDTIDITSGSGVATIQVTAEDGTVGTYTVNIEVEDTDCFVPLYSDRENLINDPYLSDATNFGGWGGRSIVVEPDSAYCGISCGLQSGGSLDYVLTGKLKTNTSYIARAMIKARSTDAKFGVYGWKQGAADIISYPTIINEWVSIELRFTTGETLNSSYGLFYNSSSGSYIDNWELYELSSDTTLSVINIDKTHVLTPEFDPTVGTYYATVVEGVDSIIISGIANHAAANALSDTVDVTSGSAVATIEVEAEDGTMGTYTINIEVEDTTCLGPLYTDRENIINDPYFSSAENFGGWGDRSIVTDADSAYCGINCGLQSGGSLDYVLTGKLKANTSYIARAMIKARSTDAKFGVYGWKDGAADVISYPTVINEWVSIELSFTTGETLRAAGHGLFFNSSAGSYIDNWELYELSSDTTLVSLEVAEGTLTPEFDPSTMEYAVEVPTGTTTINVSALATVEGATIEGVGEIAINQDTIIAVVVTAEDGLTATYSIDVTIKPNAVSKVTSNEIAVYPTVSSNAFTVVAEQGSSIKVYNFAGQMVTQKITTSNKTEVSVEKSGMYLIKVADQTFKVIKRN